MIAPHSPAGPARPRTVRKAVVPAAGLGTRFPPATKATPKEMLPVVGKPAIQYVVEEAAAAGLDDILMVTGRHGTSVPSRTTSTTPTSWSRPSRPRATPCASTPCGTRRAWRTSTTSARVTRSAWAMPSCAPTGTSATSLSPSFSATT
ncbi:sugar phosphate nucleotidyltransferase [Streptomyces sp. NPDC046915]|uniref:sugar phosphate nucleotidyltransferase n=1 Tax=Streptomyces sp. NPDC046915 TaxID=3155257 RepID=UPI003404D7B2